MSSATTRRVRRQFSRRGGAAVETAVLMILLVPLIMYALFLEDLLFYHFDQQEAVTSSPWDMMAFDFRHQSDEAATLNTAQHFNRLTYADHSSASNSYSDPTKDTTDTLHHQALAAHQCWLAQGGQQVTLAQDKFVGDVAPEFATIPAGLGGPSGGLITSSAILGVQNYFLPQNFMQDYWGEKQQVAVSKTWESDDGSGFSGPTKSADGKIAKVHDNAKQDPYVFPKDSLAVVQDSWALNYVRTIGSHDLTAQHVESDSKMHPLNLTNEMTVWAQVPYADYDSNINKAVKFADDAINKKILSSMVKIDGPMGDTLKTVPLTWSKDPTKTFSDGTAPSGYKDSRVQDTYSALQESYMGQDQAKW